MCNNTAAGHKITRSTLSGTILYERRSRGASFPTGLQWGWTGLYTYTPVGARSKPYFHSVYILRAHETAHMNV